MTSDFKFSLVIQGKEICRRVFANSPDAERRVKLATRDASRAVLLTGRFGSDHAEPPQVPKHMTDVWGFC